LFVCFIIIVVVVVVVVVVIIIIIIIIIATKTFQHVALKQSIQNSHFLK
jgi:hypothetical protein